MKVSRALMLCTVLPAVLVVCVSLLVHTEFASLGVPLFGPWAGLLYGHTDCTLAKVMPLWSWLGTGALLLGLVSLALSRRSTGRVPRASGLVLWTLAWSHWAALGGLSALNAAS